MKSIFLKIQLTFTSIIILFTAVILFFSYNTIKDNYMSALIKDMQRVNQTIAFQIKPMIENEQLDSLDTILKNVGKNNQTRLTIIAADGTVLADSEKNPLEMENHSDRPEILLAKQNETGENVRFSYTMKEGFLYEAIALKNHKNEIIAYSRVSMPMTQYETLVHEVINKILYISLIILAISIIIIFIFSKSITRPINKLAKAANKVAGGDFSTKVYLNNKDELKSLANSFNLMTEQINTLFNEVSVQKDQIDTIFKSIKDGIFVVDSKGIVNYINENLQNSVKNEKILNKYYWEVFKDVNLGKLIKKVQNTKNSQIREIQINKKYYFASAIWVESKQETVVLLYDIDEVKKVEDMKKDFIVNVSHELKTPLTAIKGFIETMEDDIDKQNQHYLDIIKRQTERLIYIVQDLLLLSRVENSTQKIEISEVNIENMFNTLIKIFRQKVNEKKLTVEIDIPETMSVIQADSFMMEQVFVNMIDNAIKYTDKGKIGIKAYKLNDKNCIEFWDTGVGIPEEHFDRIFERFYTVDKSRSRNLSGTGLGLSIVKHIVQIHGGEIKVTKNEPIGTKFVIELPETRQAV